LWWAVITVITKGWAGAAVRQVMRLGLTTASGMAAFATAWWVCQVWVGMDVQSAVGVAAAVVGLLATPMLWLSGRDQLDQRQQPVIRASQIEDDSHRPNEPESAMPWPKPGIELIRDPVIPEAALPVLWNVEPRNRSFTGRDVVLAHLREQLSVGAAWHGRSR
jgi:hypothetical protein